MEGDNMENSIISVRNLSKKYKNFMAVDNLSLDIREGEIFGLLGPNGAGKSTTILMLLGLTEPYQGTIDVAGFDPISNPVSVKKIIGYLPDNIGFYDHRTALENLVLTAQLNNQTYIQANDNALALLEKVGLADVAHKKVGKFSRGMRQRLGLADTLIKKPSIVILDEPTLGLDPMGVKDFTQLILQLSREEKLTVILSSHQLYQVQKICDRIGLFVQGKLLAQGKIDELAQSLFKDKDQNIQLRVQNQQISMAKQVLEQMETVRKVTQQGDLLSIATEAQVNNAIAETLIRNNINIVSLHQKTYGIEDIYSHYFEGGDNHESNKQLVH